MEIIPKKLNNPCKESVTRQNLHRELLFNQKIGKVVIGQKTELQKKLEKQREIKIVEEETPFQKALRQRREADQLKEAQNQPPPPPSSEFLQIHAKISNKSSKQ